MKHYCLAFIGVVFGILRVEACPAVNATPFQRFQQRQFDVVVFFRVFKSGSSTFMGALRRSKGHPSEYGRAFNVTFVEDRLDGTLQGEPRGWKGWASLRARCPGDIWLFGHWHSWDSNPDLAKLLQPVPRKRVVHLTMFREPSIWLRSVYSHAWQNTDHGRAKQPFLKWLMGTVNEARSPQSGLRRLTMDYLRMFPHDLSDVFFEVVQRFRFGEDFVEARKTSPRGATLVPPTRAMAVTALLSIDYKALDCHLRSNVLTLITEFHNTSLALLGYVLTGSTTALLPSVNKATGDHFKTWEHPSLIPPFIMGENTTAQSFMQQWAMFAPVLAPFEAVYGIAVAVFSDMVKEATASGAQF